MSYKDALCSRWTINLGINSAGNNSWANGVYNDLCAKIYQNSVSFGNSNAIFIDNVIPNCLYLFRSDHFDQKTDQWYVDIHEMIFGNGCLLRAE